MEEREAIGSEGWEGSQDAAKASRTRCIGDVGEFLLGAPPHPIKHEPVEGLQELWEAQWQEFLRTLQVSDPRVSEEPTPWDDAKAFLASFEQVASACRWPRDQWVTFLQPALSGEAEQAFGGLHSQDKGDYGKVKAAILEGEVMLREERRQHFRQLRYRDAEGPRGVYGRLRELCRQWLKIERCTKDEILELLILEQFLSILPPAMQSWIRDRKPETCIQAVTLAEDFRRRPHEAEKPERKVPFEETSVDSSEEGHVLLLESWTGQLCRESRGSQDEETRLLNPRQIWENETNSIPQEDPQQVEITDGCLGKEKESQCYKKGVMFGSPQELMMGQGNNHEKDVRGSVFCAEVNTEERETSECQSIHYTELQTITVNHGEHLVQSPSLMKCHSIHTGDEPYMPSYCGNDFIQIQDILTQERAYTGVRNTYKCSHCGKSFSCSSGFKEHMRIHPGESLYGCSYWSKNFDCSSVSREHVKNTYTGERPYKCLDCGRGFKRKSYLTTHERMHRGQNPYTCLRCGKRFSRRSRLVVHERIHTGENPFVCSECGKGFNQKGNLMTHMCLHTGEKPYKCLDCGRGFKRKSYLTTHERMHRGQNPYMCLRCGKRFPRRSRLVVHERIHTGENPFVCSECGKGFNQKGNLMTHMRLHTGEKPYKCSHCGKRFNQKAGLSTHEKTHDGVERASECGPGTKETG